MYPSESLPLRLAILMEHPSPHMVALLDALAARRDSVVEVVYCQAHAPERTWGAPTGGLRFRILPGITMPAGLRLNPGIRGAVQAIRAEAWVLNCVYNWPTTLICAALIHAAGIPFVYMAEPVRPRSGMAGKLKEVPLRFLLRRAAGVIGMGVAAEQRYRALLCPGQASAAVTYFIDLQPFLQLEKTSVVGTGPVKFVTAAQLIPRKGLDVLIRACQLLPNEGWELTIAGSGPLREQLEDAVNATGLRDRIRMIGAVPYADRHNVFSGKDVFVFPSRWDGWGMAVPEALAAGLPVISTDAAMSALEFIRDGTNGFLVPPDNIKALANAMRWFLDNRTSILSMSRSARDSVRSYRADDGASRLVQLMSELSTLKPHSMSGVDTNPEPTPTWPTLRSASEGGIRTKLRAMARRTIIHAVTSIERRRGPRGNRIVYYHLVLQQDRSRFEQHLRFFRDYFEIGSVREVVAAASSGANNKFLLALTFDDGFRVLMRDCLDLLQKYNVPATFYVPTGFIETGGKDGYWQSFSLRAFCYDLPVAPMTPADLNTLVQLGHEVQSHGVSHTALPSMTPGAFAHELQQSRDRIAQWTGTVPDSFSYPYGALDPSLANSSTLEKKGYSLAVTATRGRVTADVEPNLVPRDHAEGNWHIRDLRYFLFA